MNEQLGPHRRSTAVEFADELLFAVNFAGVGGTQHGTWGTVQFLKKLTVDVAPDSVKWPDKDTAGMVELYKQNPEACLPVCRPNGVNVLTLPARPRSVRTT